MHEAHMLVDNLLSMWWIAIAAVLAPILARAVRAGLGEDSADQVLVPIPTSARALRRRWSDPVNELLARAGREGLLPAGARIEPWLAHRSRTAGAALHLGPAPWTGSQKTRDAAGRARAEDPFVLQRPDEQDASRTVAVTTPGAMTRVAPAGTMIVNVSAGGGGKDTWIKS
mgnify:CR=1 FL=1